MDIFQAFAQVAAHGIALLRACHSRSAYDIAGLGFSLTQARAWKRAAESYLGPADSPRVQRETLAAAERAGLSIERLTMINRHARRLNRRGQAWALRAELVAMTGSYEQVNAHGTARVEEILGPSPRAAGVRFGRAKHGMRSMTVTDSQRRITDLEKTLDAVSAADEQAGLQKRSETLLSALWQHLDSRAGLIEPTYRTVIAVGLNDCVDILSGRGDEVVLGLSDGTTMTGAEMLAALMAGQLGGEIYAGLFHPSRGPVNLYEARFASVKQRILATAENLVCPWPGCAVPADRCQVHHLHPHHLGGQTVPENLTVLCKYHNGANDDDPNAPPQRGRVHRGSVDGKVRYRSPSGRELNNTHTNSSLGALNLIGV